MRIALTVTPEILAASRPGEQLYCPLALAGQEALGISYVAVYHDYIEVGFGSSPGRAASGGRDQ